jgi:hypothetical protein
MYGNPLLDTFQARAMGENDDSGRRPWPLSSDLHDLASHAVIAFQQLEQLSGDRSLEA